MESPEARRLSALKITDFQAFSREIRDALKGSVNLPNAAEQLGIGLRTLERWIAKHDELSAGIARAPVGFAGHTDVRRANGAGKAAKSASAEASKTRPKSGKSRAKR